MTGLQQLAGFCVVLIGLLAFLDRDRPTKARANYYWYDVKVGVAGRTIGSLAAIVIGGVLMFWA